MKARPTYDYFVYFIILVKVIYLALVVSLLYLKFKSHGSHSNFQRDEVQKITYWKERVELIFIVNMSILLIYLFYPWREKVMIIDDKARVLLFAYGIIILFAGKWANVFGEWIHNNIYGSRKKLRKGKARRYFGGHDDGDGSDDDDDDDGETLRKHMEIDHKIKKSENIRNLQDYPNMQNFSVSNAEYQKYYTLIYPPDTIGAVNYPNMKPLEVADAASNFSNRFPPKSSL